jgi:lipopolysaccharide transport system permease protein
VPFAIQLGMFASPVVYTSASVLAGRPEWVRHLYAANPMAGAIEGFRWALLGAPPPDPLGLAAGAAAVVAVGWTGLHFFRVVERRLPDLI